MKLKTTLLLLLCSSMLYAQSDTVGGRIFSSGRESGQTPDRIQIDITFRWNIFLSFIPGSQKWDTWVEHKYGKGNWRADGKVVSFYTNKEKDLDEKHTLDFSNSKAHFVTKPARDKNDRVIKARLKFYESEIFWIKGLDITKA